MTHPPLAAADAAAFGDELARARVLPSDRLVELLADFPGGRATDLAAHLVARRALTRYQADRALAGAARTLIVGPYRTLDRHRPGVLGPAVYAEKVGRGATVPVMLVAVPVRSLWRAKQTRELARRVAALRPHPAVVPLLDADSANGFHYLAWPLTPGDRLADRVAAAGPLPPTQVAAVLAQLAAGLAACHVAGIAHGLLSPAAVLLPSGGTPARVLDLGAGIVLGADLTGGERLLDTLTSAGAVARFLPYAAPEWTAAPAAPTPAADQFSLGAVGYFALTGRPPSPGGDHPAVVPGVTRELIATLDRLMAADPFDRFSGMEEAHAALAAAAGAADVEALLCHGSALVDPPAKPSAGSAQGGAVSWGGDTVRPAERDDSDDSVRFDLPDDVAPPVLNGPPTAPVSEPALPTWDPRPTPRPTPKPRPDPADDGPTTAPPPRLPAVPRLPAASPPRLPAAPLQPITPPPAAATPAPTPASLPPPERAAAAAAPGVVDAEPTESVLWRRVRRKVLFWKPAADTVRVHVYGPPVAARSDAPRMTAFLFPPSAAASVATLARAFDHAAELLGTATLVEEVTDGEELSVHLAVAGVAVTTPLRTMTWRGSPCRAEFDLVVPWETPLGTAAGVVSVGRAGVRVGKAEFPLVVTAARGSHLSFPERP